MLVSEMFAYVEGLREEKFQKKKTTIGLYLLLLVAVKGCVKEEERFIGSAPSSSNVVGMLERLNLNMQAQSVCGCASEVVVRSACTLTTTSMFMGGWLCRVLMPNCS